jgi:predicted dehydrogenase
MSETKRRNFLKSAPALAAGASFIGSSRVWGANDRIRVAIVGMGGRGGDLLRSAARTQGVEVAAICDPDENRMRKGQDELQSRSSQKARLVPDLRKLLEDREVDAVVITTCNHWHALATIWACQAGKHVYVEKPVSHNVFELQKMVEAARKYNRMVQAGTQRRSFGTFRKAIELIRGGTIGDLYMGRFLFTGARDSIGFQQPENPPDELLWDVWLGPAPKQPFHKNLVHYNWHWFWDFGNGELGNNGIHSMDIIAWGLDKGLPTRINSTGGRYGYKDQAETPNTQICTFEYQDGTQVVCEIRGLYTKNEMVMDFFGTKGHMRLDPNGRREILLGRNKAPEPDMGTLENIDHFRNFTDAIRAGKRELLNAEIEKAVPSMVPIHLANISYRLKRELRFDPARMRFVNDPEADRMLTRNYRQPYVVPEKV